LKLEIEGWPVCGRYIVREQEALEKFLRRFGTHGRPKVAGGFNVAPSSTVPVIRRSGLGRAAFESAAYGSAALNECVLLRWGLVPFWSCGTPPKYPTFNAPIERMEIAASFRGPWARSQRCIIPAAGFYEWQVRGRARQPFLIRVADQEVFGFAGLWDRSAGPEGIVESCTIVTMPANRLLAEIHNTGHRMPAILREEHQETWLSGNLDEARTALLPYPHERMMAWPVSLRVNSPKNDDETLVRPVPAAEPTEMTRGFISEE
jgi:putative SOS response-associated peptidase YedK